MKKLTIFREIRRVLRNRPRHTNYGILIKQVSPK